MIDVLHKVGELIAAVIAERDDEGVTVSEEDRIEAIEHRISGIWIRAKRLENAERHDAPG